MSFHIRCDSYNPTDEPLAAIQKLTMREAPRLTYLHGFVNQQAPFLATASIMEPFRESLRKPHGKKVYWDAQVQHKFL